MKNKYIIGVVLLIFFAMNFVSCSKDKDEPETPVYVEPTIADRDVIPDIPAGLQQLANDGDIYAISAIGYMGIANTIGTFASSFTVPADIAPQNASNGGSLYHWSYGGYSYWMTFDNGGNKYTWKYEYEFPGYSRFTYIQAEESKDGKSGSWTIFDPEDPDNEIWVYNWSVDNNDNFSATLTMDDGEGDISIFTVTSNNNSSGSFVYNLNGIDEAEVTWNADGSGDYWFYNDGTEITNSWTAN